MNIPSNNFMNNFNISTLNSYSNLQTVNNGPNNEINNLNNQIQNLNNEINRLRKENEVLQNENNNLKNELKIKNQNIDKYTLELKDLNKSLNIKDNIINDLNNQISNLSLNRNSQNIKFGLNEIVTILFKSIDQNVEIPLSIPKSELFVRLEEKLYEQCPELRDLNNYFTANGRVIKRFRTIQENKLNDCDKILVNVYE